MSENGNLSAFCVLHTIDGNWNKEPHPNYRGLTKREYFAGLALQGLLSNPAKDFYFADACAEALLHADGLLTQLGESK